MNRSQPDRSPAITIQDHWPLPMRDAIAWIIGYASARPSLDPALRNTVKDLSDAAVAFFDSDAFAWDRDV